MYYFPQQPPYILLVVGFLVALTSGAALAGTLKIIVQKWQSDGAETSSSRISTSQLLVPFLGITIGVCLFLCSGFEIFGFPPLLAYAVGVPVTLLTCVLVWLQLGSMLAYVERQGIQAMDLDSLR
ncbi:MAG: hypothetical protein SAL70_30120 [Scytonema sp. PMC 1070.18]|nr:hypothetical protein [Scytonema sp. PMC 1070.18]